MPDETVTKEYATKLRSSILKLATRGDAMPEQPTTSSQRAINARMTLNTLARKQEVMDTIQCYLMMFGNRPTCTVADLMTFPVGVLDIEPNDIYVALYYLDGRAAFSVKRNHSDILRAELTIDPEVVAGLATSYMNSLLTANDKAVVDLRAMFAAPTPDMIESRDIIYADLRMALNLPAI